MSMMLGPMYNLDNPVGQGESNRPDDVKLVQVMLLELHRVGPGWAPSNPIVPNGMYTPALTEWIRAFQQLVNSKNPNALVVDGKIHPMKMVTTRDYRSKFPSGHWSTMYALNDITRLKSKDFHTGLGTRLNITEPRQEAVVHS